MASFSIPLTGLEADSTALNTIANNLSNMSTTAFKSQSAQFSNLFYQQLSTAGSGDPISVGAGTQVASTQTDFTQGTVNQTGQSTDLALQGDGFFVINDNGNNIYTRAGNFTLASSGNLTTQAGLNVMGYPATNGVVNTNAALTAINIPVGQVEQPKASTSFGMTANLDSVTPSGGTFPAQVQVYDSLGTSHMVDVTYSPTGTANQWNYSINLAASDFAGGVAPAATTGTLQFDSSGNLQSVTQTAPNPVALTNVGTAPGDLQSIPVKFINLADGAANLNMNFNLLGSAGTPTIKQVDQDSAASNYTTDGYPSGQYKDFAVQPDGTVSANFSNGQSLTVGQLALASITNEQGLQLLAGGNYGTTLASGQASIGVSGSGGRGTVQGGALEGSNVNISGEFSNLIVAQRAFEANSKAVTTFDTVTEETIQMIH